MFSFKRSLIALVGVLVLVGALAAVMPLVSRGQGGNPLTRDPRPSYYLTQTTHNGSQVLTACAEGYHMASLWEIFQTSNLKYNITLGLTRDDSGSGPPTAVGWIRTGTNASGALGNGNCQAWTSASADDFGAVASLVEFWESTDVTVVSPWSGERGSCPLLRRVWCVQD